MASPCSPPTTAEGSRWRSETKAAACPKDCSPFRTPASPFRCREGSNRSMRRQPPPYAFSSAYVNKPRLHELFYSNGPENVPDSVHPCVAGALQSISRPCGVALSSSIIAVLLNPLLHEYVALGIW